MIYWRYLLSRHVVHQFSFVEHDLQYTVVLQYSHIGNGEMFVSFITKEPKKEVL